MSKKRILLVEDTADDVELMLLALHRQKQVAHIDVARNGVEALNYLTGHEVAHVPSHRNLPDLIFLDLNMPLLDGFDVLKAVRADSQLHWLPVVVFTSSMEMKDIKRAYALGASSYIHKPVDFKQFSHNLERIAEYWLALNINPQQSTFSTFQHSDVG